MDTLGERIGHLRRERNITQKKLSEILGVTPRMVSFYESNDREPSTEVLAKIANYFDTTVDYLIGNSANRYARNDQEFAKNVKRVLYAHGMIDNPSAELSSQQQKEIEELFGKIAKVYEIIKND